jgi:sterol 24-C-methyltransferase
VDADPARIVAAPAHTARVIDFYDKVTDFYEFGWGQAFHFAPMFRGETFAASIARHEYWLSAQLGLQPGMQVLDAGCGVGGPMRAIARFSGATVVGVNNNKYQLARAEKHTADAGLTDRCRVHEADFMHLPFEPESFDAVYVIEASCHAPDVAGLFTELARVMKPGARIASYEWCMTGAYRPDDPAHRSIKRRIENGNALAPIRTIAEVLSALEVAGLDLLASSDRAATADSETPWYWPLSARFSLDGFKHTALGRAATQWMVRALEILKIVPKGTAATSALLQDAAAALVRGGETGIFTPMFHVLARKPSGTTPRQPA